MEFASQAQRTWGWFVDHSAILRRVRRAFRESEEDHTNAGGPDLAPGVAAVGRRGALGREHGLDTLRLSFSDPA